MEHSKTENEQKKEYLWRYQSAVQRISRIESELEEIRALRASISVNNDGLPRGSGQSDLSGYFAELDELERRLVDERYEKIKLYKDIVQRINRLKSRNENDVLFYRYIKAMDWWEIAERMNYSERWIHKLHGKALAHFELPKEDSKVQSSSVEVQ